MRMRVWRGLNLLYIHSTGGNLLPRSMDKFWSICVVPIGIVVCFGPAIVTWFLTEWKNPPAEKRDEQR